MKRDARSRPHSPKLNAWLEMSGAKSYEPFLHVERAELARLGGDEAAREREFREAHRLFTEIGAPIRAAEVARELGSVGVVSPSEPQGGNHGK
jgi:hypothetical protein